MRFVIQRVTESEVKVDGETLGKIGKGFMVLIGVSDSDTKDTSLIRLIASAIRPSFSWISASARINNTSE